VIPLGLKIVYTLFVCALVPIYWRQYGAANFLWFSDIALLAFVPRALAGERSDCQLKCNSAYREIESVDS